MRRPHGSGGLDRLYEAAGGRRGEQRAMIVLGVLGLALALTFAAVVTGRAVTPVLPEPARPTAPVSVASDADSLAEAALGADLQTTSGTPRPDSP